MKLAVLPSVDHGEVGFAELRGGRNDRIEHRLQMARRPADDVENFGGGGLLLERFVQLVEQPRVLDGDDGLFGEILDQRDLLVGKRAHLLAVNTERADQLIPLEYRYRQYGPRATVNGDSGRSESLGGIEVTLFGANIGNVDCLPRQRDSRETMGR